MHQKELANEEKLNNLSNEIIRLEKKFDDYKTTNLKEGEFRNKEFNDIKTSTDKIINDNYIDNKIENIASKTAISIVDQYLT